MKTRSRSRRGTLRQCIELLEARTLLSFGLTTTSTTYVVDNGANLTFTILRSGSTSNTVHLGDMTSVKYKGQEMLASYSVTSRYSHYEQGLSSSTVVSATVDPNSQWILITCDDSAIASGAVIQYYAIRKGDNNIYMASLPMDVTNGPGEGRYIAYLSRSVFTTPEAPSDNAGNTGAIEGSDVFGHADGTTTSKFYNMNRRMIDNVYHGVTGTAGGNRVGAWMFMGNREHSAGGPFFKDIDFQSGSAVEIYNCLFTGHTQTESYRQGLQGPYAFQFTDGSTPTTPDYSWMEALNLRGWIPAAQRGALTGTASGVPSGHDVVIGLSNSTAQYWVRPDSSGRYTISGVQPGTYVETLYDTELEVGQKTVTIAAGATTNANIVDTFYIPSNPIFRIGTWDGTPGGFLNADKISTMHPSDVRMSSWTSLTNYIVGTNSDAQWPMAEFMGVNNSLRITFALTSAQVQNLTLRIGITLGFSGARPRVTVNSGKSYAWTSAIPTASADLNSRGVTRGTWRGDNQLYTYAIPSSALRAGTNTIDLPMVSGSYVSGATWLSPNVVFDAIDLIPTSSTPSIASVTITPANSNVALGGTKAFTAVAKDSAGNVLNANFSWSATRGTIDANGNYTAPATAGNDTITATATIYYNPPGYATTSSTTRASGATITGSGSTSVKDVAPAWLDQTSEASWDPVTKTLTVTGQAKIIADPGTDLPQITVAAGGVLDIQPSTDRLIHLGGLTDNGTVNVRPVVNRSQSNHVALILGTVAGGTPVFVIASGAKLDLFDNDLIVHNGNLATVQGFASRGRNVAAGGVYDGTWNGSGLTSSAAASADAIAGYELNLLAVVRNADLFLGQFSQWNLGGTSEALRADGNDILVKYTYNGDLALEGYVGDDSLTVISSFYDNGATNQGGYAFGDLNGDGLVDDTDLTIISAVYGNGLLISGMPLL